MRKGDLVRFNLDNIVSWGDNTILAHRPITDAETHEWYDNPNTGGLDSAGESKLPPMSISMNLPRGGVFTVIKSRCQVKLSYGNPTPKMTKIFCAQTGNICYVKRSLLEVCNE